MSAGRTLIQDGLVLDPASGVQARQTLLLEGGKVAAVTCQAPLADRVIDASGKVVAPGFVDIHMHENSVGPDGSLEAGVDRSIFPCMLRMGVTTVVVGSARHQPVRSRRLFRSDRPGRRGTDCIVAAHIRSDDAEVFDAAREFLEVGQNLGLSVQVSHIGSIAGFGQMEEFLHLEDDFLAGGLRVSCDCYGNTAQKTVCRKCHCVVK